MAYGDLVPNQASSLLGNVAFLTKPHYQHLMAFDPLALGQTIRPKRNRGAYPHEVAILDEERVLNDNFINSLQKELGTRILRANEAAEDVKRTAGRRAEAELCLRAANAIRDALIKAKNGLYSSFSGTDPLLNHLRALGLDNGGPNLQAIADLSAQRAQCEEFLNLQIESTNTRVLILREAVIKNLEDEEVATACEERCLAVVGKIKKYISEIKETADSPLGHSIWRVPESLWCQIFAEVVYNDVELEEAENLRPSAAISFPSLTLSAVCHSWRTIAHSYPLLWRTIHLTIEPFSLRDGQRIRHYVKLSKNRALRILIEVPPTASASQLDSVAKCLSGTSQVEVLIVRGGASGRSVILLLSQFLLPPKSLTIAFSDDCRYQSLDANATISSNLEELKLKGCSPYPLGALDVEPQSRKIRRLHVRNTLSTSFNWRTFREKLPSIANTLQDLVYTGGFYQTRDLDCGVGPTFLSQLTSLTAELEVILLFYTAKIYTPALQSLTVVVLRGFDLHAEWRADAGDPRGGGNVTAVKFEQNGPPNGPLHVRHIEFLPKLTELSLQGKNVEQILQGLNVCAQYRHDHSERPGRRALKALRLLSLTDYDGDGQQLVPFARNYQQRPRSDTDLKSNPISTDGIDVLKVELRNCPNISAEVRAELLEMGSIPCEQMVLLDMKR